MGDEKLEVRTNRHPNLKGEPWGWVSGAPGVDITWDGKKGRASAEAIVAALSRATTAEARVAELERELAELLTNHRAAMAGALEEIGRLRMVVEVAEMALRLDTLPDGDTDVTGWVRRKLRTALASAPVVVGAEPCANCGTAGAKIAGGMLQEGESVCSRHCYDQLMELGCPQENGGGYRPAPVVVQPTDKPDACPNCGAMVPLVEGTMHEWEKPGLTPEERAMALRANSLHCDQQAITAAIRAAITPVVDRAIIAEEIAVEKVRDLEILLAAERLDAQYAEAAHFDEHATLLANYGAAIAGALEEIGRLREALREISRTALDAMTDEDRQ